MELIEKITTSILVTFYQAFFFSAVLAVAITLLYIHYSDVKAAIKEWISSFKTNKHFRWLFFMTLYTVMILFRTLLNRNMWANPVSNVFGVWGLYDESGALTTQAVENFILFIPFAIMLLHINNHKKLDVTQRGFQAIWYGVKYAFLFSSFIEFTQLFLRLGTFQLSDFFYNTAGGFAGALCYYAYLRIKELFSCFRKEEQ